MSQQKQKGNRTKIRELHLKRGDRHRQLGNYAKAVEELQKAIAIDPQYTDAYSSLGMTHTLMKNREQAISCFEKALALDANDVSVYYKLGNAYVEAERFDEAKAITTAALEFNADLEKVHYVLGRTYFGMKIFDEALHHFQLSHELASDEDRADVNFDYFIGHTQALLGDFDLALAHFQKALAQEPDVSSLHAIIAMVYVKQGKFDEAEDSIADAFLLNPTCVYAYLALEQLEACQNSRNQEEQI